MKPARDGQKATEARLLLRRHRSHVQAHRGRTLKSRRGTTVLMRRQKTPNSTMLPSLGNRRARMIMYGKNDLALQLFFFFFPPSRLLRFDFNAFCVVLYFHAKILLYLNVFILLNVFQIFFLLYPRIAVIIHVAVFNFFL